MKLSWTSTPLDVSRVTELFRYASLPTILAAEVANIMDALSLYASGEDFDVAAFLAATSLVPTSIQRKGERKSSARFPSYFENSAVIFELGDGRSLSWQEQEATAIAFLKEHREELRTLAQFPGVERFELGLRYFSIADPSLIMFCVQASSQLMWHLLDTGCSVMWLITLDRNDPEDDA